MIPLSDRFGRRVKRLRLSVTDRCNFHCLYCLPVTPCWMPSARLLHREEILRLARVATGLGIDRVRLTGGEPLLRRDLVDIVRDLAALPGLADLSLSTNAYMLDRMARPLRDAGLRRVNVSLDSLRPRTFARMSGHDGLDRVLDGLAAADRAGLQPIKINTVILRGVNDGEIDDLGRFSRAMGYQVRFIEYMPLDNAGAWSRWKVVTAEEILSRLAAIAPLVADMDADPSDPAQVYRFADGEGSVGIIPSVSRPFCRRCDRIRITADGKVRTCLFAAGEADLLSPLRAGAGEEALAQRIREAVAGKEAGHLIGRAEFQAPSRAMSAIGG